MSADQVCGSGARSRKSGSGQVAPILREALRVVTLAAMLAVIGPVGAGAQSPRETLLGEFRTGEAKFGPDRSRIAADMLADGIAALDRGDIMIGRRRLESLVERFPDTVAASAARGQLDTLYTARRRTADEPGAADGATPRLIPTHQGGAEARAAPAPREERAQRLRQATDDEAALRQRQPHDERRLLALANEFQSMTGDRVFFGETTADLGARARTVLAGQARWLAGHPELPVVVEAHADDNRGNRDLDVRLAERRGQAVRDRLVEEGVSAERITIQVFGRDRPVATCGSPECAAQNRRVVTRIGGPTEATNSYRREADPALATAPRGGWHGRSD